MRKVMFHPWCFTKLGIQSPPPRLAPFLPPIPHLFPCLHLPLCFFKLSLLCCVTCRFGQSWWTRRPWFVCVEQIILQLSQFFFFVLLFLLQIYLTPQRLNQHFAMISRTANEEKWMSHINTKAARILVLQCCILWPNKKTVGYTWTQWDTLVRLYWSCTTAKRGTQHIFICNLSKNICCELQA